MGTHHPKFYLRFEALPGSEPVGHETLRPLWTGEQAPLVSTYSAKTILAERNELGFQPVKSVLEFSSHQISALVTESCKAASEQCRHHACKGIHATVWLGKITR